MARYATASSSGSEELPELADVASDLQNDGRQVALLFDRPTASRLGITAQNIDDTLYDGFGQRQVSTLFTQLNQYHVIWRLQPEFQRRTGRTRRHLICIRVRGAVPLSAITKASQSTRADL